MNLMKMIFGILIMINKKINFLWIYIVLESVDLYSNGKCQKFPITMQDIKDYNYKVGMTYWAFEDGRMLEEDAIKDSIKIDVDSALADLERNNKK